MHGPMARPPSDEVVVYLPDNTVRRGYLSIVADIVSELRDSRWLTYQLFKRDVLAFYKQSLLGVFWMLLVPLVTVGTFIALRSSGVVATGEMTAPYPIFASLGIAVWQLFAQGVVAGANSLVAGGDMLTRINFSKKSLVIASMGRTVVSFAVIVVAVAILFLVYGARGYAYQPTLALLVVPFTLVPLLLLTLGLSFYLSLINGIVRDIGAVLGVVVTFLMLLTPVLYQRPAATGAGDFLATITAYNPLYYLVSAPRELVLGGNLIHPTAFMISAAGASVFFLFALLSFHLSETRIAERI